MSTENIAKTEIKIKHPQLFTKEVKGGPKKPLHSDTISWKIFMTI